MQLSRGRGPGCDPHFGSAKSAARQGGFGKPQFLVSPIVSGHLVVLSFCIPQICKARVYCPITLAIVPQICRARSSLLSQYFDYCPGLLSHRFAELEPIVPVIRLLSQYFGYCPDLLSHRFAGLEPIVPAIRLLSQYLSYCPTDLQG